MRVLMLEPPAGEQHAGFDQGFDHRLVGVAPLAFVGEHVPAGKSRRLFGEAAVGIDGIGYRCIDAELLTIAIRHPDFHLDVCYFVPVLRPHVEIFAPMTGRGMYKSRTRIVGNMRSCQKRHRKIVATKLFQRMVADKQRELAVRNCTHSFEGQDASLSKDVHGQLVGQNQPIIRLGPVAAGRVRYFVQAIFDLRRKTDRPVSGNGPGSRRPYDDRSRFQFALEFSVTVQRRGEVICSRLDKGRWVGARICGDDLGSPHRKLHPHRI